MRYSPAIGMMVLALAAKPALAQSDTDPRSASDYPDGLQARVWVMPEPSSADFSGPRAEVRLDWAELDAPGPSYGHCGIDFCRNNTSVKLDSNFNVGGELGYDFPLSRRVTVGPYVKFTNKVSNSSDCLACAGDDYAVGVRVGYVLTNKFLLYGKFGYNNLRTKVVYSNIIIYDNYNLASDVVQYQGEEFAFGVNYRSSNKYYVGLELGFNDYGSSDLYYGNNQGFDVGITFGRHF